MFLLLLVTNHLSIIFSYIELRASLVFFLHCQFGRKSVKAKMSELSEITAHFNSKDVEHHIAKLDRFKLY